MSDESVEAAAQRTLEASPIAAREARRFVTATLSRWEKPALADVEVVASELVTNAVVHSGGEIEMRLTLCDDRLRIEVTDPERDCLPVLHPRPPRPEGGYGLHLVDAIAHSWGCRPTDGHKTVWAEIDLAPSTP